MLFCALPVFCKNKSGQHDIDKLAEILSSASPDTTKFNTCELLAQAYSDSCMEKTIDYEFIALKIARKIEDAEKEIETLLTIGKYYNKYSLFRKAMTICKEGIAVSKDKSLRSLLPELYLEEGISYYRLTMFDSARVCLDNCSRINKKYRNAFVDQSTHAVLGNLSIEEKNNKTALEHYIQALKIAEELKNDWRICSSLSNIANFYYTMGNDDKALEYTKQCLGVLKNMKMNIQTAYTYHLLGKIYTNQGKLAEAINAYNYSMKLFEEFGSMDYVAQLHIHLGNAYRKKDNKQEALKEFWKTIELEKKTGCMFNTTFAYCNIGEIYYDMKLLDKSLCYFDSALLLAEKQRIQEVRLEVHQYLSYLFSDKKDYHKAFIHQQKYITLKDSIDAVQQKKEAFELEARYQSERKEGEIRTLNAENRVKNIQLYSIIGFSVLSLLLLFALFNRYTISLKSRKKLEELDQIKSRFFTNITHEFKTPLSLIMAPLQSHIEKTSDMTEKQELCMMFRNAQRLNILINQLLDLSKIETANMKLAIEEIDLGSILKAYYSNFQSMAKIKKIDFSLEIENPSHQGFADIDKLGKIVYNLLSNAFKFTPRKGQVLLNINMTEKQLTVQVSDTGKGIPADKIDLIFNRFYMVDDSFTRNTEGTGIGLALSKEMAEIHKGKLTATSIEGKGSVFTLTLPIDKESYKNEISQISKDDTQNEKNQYHQHINPFAPFPQLIINDEDLPLIMIIEDNEDMLAFLVQILKSDYRLLTAVDGNDAWNKIQTIVPDLVISDIMMPGIDGNTLCVRIKTNTPTSHIPVILLTAKTTQHDKIEGIQSGADIYITKPFDSRELIVCIQNLLKQRTILRELFSENENLPSGINLFLGQESDFLKKFISLVKENHMNSEFSVDSIVIKMSTSRMQLHNKIKALTGFSPGEYLRYYRLEMAKKLLLIKGALVSEVAYKIGYNNLSNFTIIFKEYCGYTPSEYIQNHAIEIQAK